MFNIALTHNHFVFTEYCIYTRLLDVSQNWYPRSQTTRPAKGSTRYYCEMDASWGFISSCEELARGVKGMVKDKPMDG
ncbi:hypothetical protein VHEMI09335 [[Torrubiella] hemipterigena]|uniref:Uncharacterized protein n=1 Tax=[Torrubiella] hemipterigena TaxID=1531966 RepID=A0A0A1TPV9_9HYPO|nr:hypothetical protein VHEMI09335 [[Torrubiella] hemipterigena]